nr:hypothetical protein [Tanacetum cinerariifolium]
MLNPTSDVGVESIFSTASSPIVSLQPPTPIMTPCTIATTTTSGDAPIPPPTIPSIILENQDSLHSAFRFEERLRSLETSFFEYRQTNLFADVVSAIPGIVQQFMTQQMTEAVREAVQIQTNRLQDSLQRENDEFLRNIDENMKKIIKGQVKNQVKEHVSPDLSEMELKKILIEKMEGSKVSPDLSEMELKKILIEKMEGKLEYHLEEVYKATTDQLDWDNPKGQQYPHNLLQPLPLIPDNRGRRVIPFAHFINNDIEYLRGGASSRKYTTSVTKTKAADYGHIKWIENLVPHTIWIQEPLNYDKHALLGVYHWGRKRQQFYSFAVNRESALDVYSKRRIIAVTDLKIVEWHNYKHLDWISIRHDDDKIYKFKEGDFKRLRL